MALIRPTQIFMFWEHGGLQCEASEHFFTLIDTWTTFVTAKYHGQSLVPDPGILSSLLHSVGWLKDHTCMHVARPPWPCSARHGYPAAGFIAGLESWIKYGIAKCQFQAVKKFRILKKKMELNLEKSMDFCCHEGHKYSGGEVSGIVGFLVNIMEFVLYAK